MNKKLKLRYVVAGIFLFLLYSPMVTGQGFKAEKSMEGVRITEGDDLILFYQSRLKSHEGTFERANYIHPLYGLQGEILTEDFPADHLHHRGIFWAWHQTRVDGKQVADGWAIENMTWDVTNVKTETNKKQASLTMEVIWKTLPGASESQAALVKENTIITVYPTDEHSRVVDFTISLKALVAGLEIGGSEDIKGYSGFSLRLKLPEDLAFTSEGKKLEPEITAVEGGPWLDITGTFDPTHPSSGVAVFCHPKYPKKKQPWILRYKGSMQNPAFPHTDRVAISQKKPLVLKYRLVIHDQEVDSAILDKMYQEYISH